MEAWSLDDHFAKIEQQCAYVREVLEDFAIYDFRDSGISGWSCGEHVSHVALVAHRIAAGTEENLADPVRDSDGEWAEPAEWILKEGDFPRSAAQPLPRVDTAGRPREDSLPVFPEAVKSWVTVRSKSADLPGCLSRFPHFALGYLTSTEWVRFCTQLTTLQSCGTSEPMRNRGGEGSWEA